MRTLKSILPVGGVVWDTTVYGEMTASFEGQPPPSPLYIILRPNKKTCLASSFFEKKRKEGGLFVLLPSSSPLNMAALHIFKDNWLGCFAMNFNFPCNVLFFIYFFIYKKQNKINNKKAGSKKEAGGTLNIFLFFFGLISVSLRPPASSWHSPNKRPRFQPWYAAEFNSTCSSKWDWI